MTPKRIHHHIQIFKFLMPLLPNKFTQRFCFEMDALCAQNSLTLHINPIKSLKSFDHIYNNVLLKYKI